MKQQANCRRCDHSMQIGDGWSLLSKVVECEGCFTLNEIHVDEDSDCDYWFVAEIPYSAEQMP